MNIDQVKKATHDALAVVEALDVPIEGVHVHHYATPEAPRVTVRVTERDFLRLFAGHRVQAKRSSAASTYGEVWIDLNGVRVACFATIPGTPAPAIEDLDLPVIG